VAPADQLGLPAARIRQRADPIGLVADEIRFQMATGLAGAERTAAVLTGPECAASMGTCAEQEDRGKQRDSRRV